MSKYFQRGTTWSFVSSSYFGVRQSDKGFVFDVGGSTAFPQETDLNLITGYLCSSLAYKLMNVMNPTMNFQVGNVASLPILEDKVAEIKPQVDEIVEEAVAIARADWDSFETSWDFTRLPMLAQCGSPHEVRAQNDDETKEHTYFVRVSALKVNSVEECWREWESLCNQRLARMQQLETENNRLFINAYGLQDELAPEVPLEQITLARADAAKDTRRLLSYFVGCAMGRYSLDAPGLIYADAGNLGFDPSRYTTFPADADGIIPVTDLEWFDDEAAIRFAHFVRCAFRDEGRGMRDETEQGVSGSSLIPHPSSLAWVAQQLNPKASETPLETVRRYFSQSFFKDHTQTYKKRPIYWLFSSGKHKAFECLVYLHRYHAGTLARMRTDYVTPLLGKMHARREMLAQDQEAAPTTAAKNKIAKQLEALRHKLAELAQFDDQLRHYADKRITLDLDDGVKVNYGKFGNLLADVKIIAAEKE